MEKIVVVLEVSRETRKFIKRLAEFLGKKEEDLIRERLEERLEVWPQDCPELPEAVPF